MRMQEQTTEYDKLDLIDRKVLHWTIKNVPSSVPNWIEYTVKSYQSLKGIEIDGLKLLREIKNDGLKNE
jgi:hypothetical protein